MIGEVFSRLTVVAFLGSYENSKKMWECRCECGSRIIVPTGGLRSGNTKSCGCLRTELQTKHGLHKSRTYRIWQAMLNRCRQEQHAKYYRHVEVCERWKEFTNFLDDMGEAQDGLTIDRINNASGYSPDNCRWATRGTQSRNTRRRIEYEHAGAKKSLIEWSETLGVSHELLRGRIRRGWSFEDAIAAN